MPPSILRSQPGIKRDGTTFDGDACTDGQWVRFQRGLPRKIGGYRSINKYLSEISRGFTSFGLGNLQYCHSGGAETLERFTIDETKNSSVISDRTPVAVAATGSVTLTSGAAGSVNSVTVNGVTITSGAVAFNTSLSITATDLATNINAFTSSPNYSAAAVGAVVTITASTAGAATNGFVVTATLTTITATYVNMSGGSDALVADDDNVWMFDYEFDSSSTANSIIAHAAPNGGQGINDAAGQIFIGEIDATAALVEIQLPDGVNATGGIVCVHPYLFYYGSSGVIGWSVAGDPTDLSGSGSGAARPWGQKIIKGFPLRGGSGASPAAIFWAFDAIVRGTFVGGSAVFQFDTISTGTSIMSANSVVDYDGTFFWAGVDRFMMFNGVAREVPNAMNLNWFFDGLNETQRSKVFAFTVKRYGEIWWAYPRGDETECSHAVIYNVRENTWYDTELPLSGRSAGTFNNSFAAPLLTDATETADGFRVWIHEQGTDAIDGTDMEPILSYFVTADNSAIVNGINSSLNVMTVEPDFVQSGPMTMQIFGRQNARAPDIAGTLHTFPESASTASEQTVLTKAQRRELRVKFASNCIGGDYQAGQIIIHLEQGDGTQLS